MSRQPIHRDTLSRLSYIEKRASDFQQSRTRIEELAADGIYAETRGMSPTVTGLVISFAERAEILADEAKRSAKDPDAIDQQFFMDHSMSETKSTHMEALNASLRLYLIDIGATVGEA